jgi:hypothetical protein
MNAQPTFTPEETASKIAHAVTSMLAAKAVADAAPTLRQRRIFTRYVHVHAEPAQAWLKRALTDLLQRRETDETERQPMDRAVRRVRRAWADHQTVRNHLAAKRRSLSEQPSTDMVELVAAWATLTGPGTDELIDAITEAARAFGVDVPTEVVSPGETAEVARALANIAPAEDAVHTDATSYTVGEPFRLAITPSGAIGRKIAQVNDVAEHIEQLYALRDIAGRPGLLGRLLRGALIIETCALAELVIGPPDSRRTRFTEPTLNELTLTQALPDEPDILGCIQGDELETFRTWAFFVRDKATAHLDVNLPLSQILELLDEAVPEVTLGFADGMLDVLDLAACHLIPLRLLVLGQRRISGLAPAVTASVPASHAPASTRALLDGPHLGYAAGGFASNQATRAAGIIAGRGRSRRARWYQPPAEDSGDDSQSASDVSG